MTQERQSNRHPVLEYLARIASLIESCDDEIGHLNSKVHPVTTAFADG